MATAQLLVGTSGWSYADRVRPFYPAGTAPRDCLACHCRESGAEEIDSTSSRIPTARMADGWQAASPKGFRSAPRTLQAIIHEKRLRHAVEIRHRGWLNEALCQLPATHRIAPVLPDRYDRPKRDRLTTDFASIRLLGKRCAVPDDFSHVRIDRDRALDLWARPIRRHLAQGDCAYVLLTNHRQLRGPATARARLSRLAPAVSVP